MRDLLLFGGRSRVRFGRAEDRCGHEALPVDEAYTSVVVSTLPSFCLENRTVLFDMISTQPVTCWAFSRGLTHFRSPGAVPCPRARRPSRRSPYPLRTALSGGQSQGPRGGNVVASRRTSPVFVSVKSCLLIPDSKYFPVVSTPASIPFVNTL